jgi:hypothetical protein
MHLACLTRSGEVVLIAPLRRHGTVAAASVPIFRSCRVKNESLATEREAPTVAHR